MTATGTRVQLAPGADAGDVLDRVRANHRVRSFAVTQPRLSEMFLAALGDDAGTGADADAVIAAVADTAATVDIDVTIDAAATVDAARQLVVDGDADFGLVGAPDGVVTILQRTDEATVIVPITQEVLRRTAADRIFSTAGVDQTVVDRVSNLAPATVETVDTERGGRQATAFGLTIVMYLLIMLLSQGIAASVATEKANRVSEVLLAVAPTRSLLFGKVIGMGALGLASIFVGALPIVVKTIMTSDMPEGMGTTLASSALWVIGGIVIYLLLAAMLGALADRTEEVGGTVAPLTVALIAIYIVSLSTLETTVGVVLSIVPISSPIVMPARIAVGAATAPQIVASVLCLVVGTVVAARLAIVVYSRALVRTGKRLRLMEVLRSPS